MKKEYVVMGLGRFGRSVARQLEKNGCRVMAIDINEEVVNAIAPQVTTAIKADVSDINALNELDVKGFEGAIVGIGGSLEAAVMATLWAKENGVKTVIAKGYNATYGKVLEKVGADRIVFPEKEMGVFLADALTNYAAEKESEK